MDIAMKALYLLAGCAVFMMGLQQMSEGLERSAGAPLRRLFTKISNNRFASYGIGFATTSVIQSSSATSVMTMGLANAGIVNLFQGSGIILGAKVGTTVTGIIIAFFTLSKGSFSLGIVFASLALIGVLLTIFSKKDVIKRFALFLAGFGLLFMGLEIMSSAFKDAGFSMAFMGIFEKYLNNGFMCLLAGLLLTCVIQSSSAASGIFLTMLGGGIITDLGQAMFLMIGANVGTCITALIAAVGASQNAKRIAFFHIFTSVFGAIILGIPLAFTSGSLAKVMTGAFGSNPEGLKISLALFNLVYNLSYTLLLLPFMHYLVKLSKVVIRDKDLQPKGVIEHIDERILATPAIAVGEIQKEVLNMARRAKNNLELSFRAIMDSDVSRKTEVYKQEDALNYLNKKIANFLIKLSALSLSEKDLKLVGSLHHVINDIERIGDHAKNFMQFAEDMISRQLIFEAECMQEAQSMYDKVNDMFNESIYILEYRDTRRLESVSNAEDEVDSMSKVFFEKHIERLHKGTETLESGTYYYDFISELERVADHIVNIAFSIKSPVGTQNLGYKRYIPPRKNNN